MATKDIRFLKADLQKFIGNIVTAQILLSISQSIRDTIYKRTKSGKGLSRGGTPVGGAGNETLPKLSEAYVKYRQNKILGPFAAAARSNVTFSGELLESIIYRVTGKKAIVEIQDIEHSGPTPVRMRELVAYLEKQGRYFFGLSDTEVKIIDNLFKRKIRDRIRELNK